MRNRQFYTYKFKSSRLKEFDYNINLTFDEAKEYKEVIALADSQILRNIRDIRGKETDYDSLENLFFERDIIKKRKKTTENSEKIAKIQEKINEILFIPDYITVVMEYPSHYKKMYEDGIIINNKKYSRISCSAGQARVSTVVFCCDEIIDELKRRLNNGRDLNKKISPSKFNTYFGLAGSATFLVSEPKFIVVKDYENVVKFQSNFVTETDWNTDDKITQQEVEVTLNRTDGMGLITPRQAEIWANDLGIDWIPSQFCIRQNFIKGMLCVFDIHNFCNEKNNGNYIIDTIYKDKNGQYIKADLRDYDVIISESQFKLWDSFDSLDTYINNCHKNKLYWGVSQYTPKKPKDILKLNYQFIQTLNLNKNQIEKLAEEFVNWITKVSYDDINYMLLFLLGTNHSENSIMKYIKESDNYWIKSLIYNHSLKDDKYIRIKIRELLKIKIQNGCMGDIFTDGNFQVLVYDPYAFMQHVCGREVTGLLKKNEFYSNYWNEKNVSVVDGMRSPLTYRSEHVVLNLKKNEETEKWFKYCKQGIILNYFGHEVVNFGGADVDYDILATTSNQQIINGVYKNELPVVYEPPKPEKIVFTDDDLYNADTFSFGSIIGSITNKSSNAYALLSNLEKEYGIDSNEYKVTLSRLKQCCKAQSAQIDKAKIGREVKGIPKLWVNKQEYCIYDDGENKEILDTIDEIKEKDFYNSILINKYPYFFKYLYKDARRKYKKYCDENEVTCHQKFKMSYKKLTELKRLLPEQKEFINNYNKYMPLTLSDSPMNLLCQYIEGINFDINNKIKETNSVDILDLYKNKNHLYTKEDFYEIINVLKEHMNKVKYDKTLPNEYDTDYNFNESIIEESNADNDLLEDKLNSICSDVYLVVNCLLDYFYIEKPSMNKDILWNTYGRYIFENVKINTIKKPMFPFPEEKGDIIYLNKTYKLKEIDI